MDTRTETQIYLADQRGLSQTDVLRSYHTFNFGGYVAEGREPFGPLHLLNDDTLRAGASLTLRVEQPTDVLLLPLAGGLEYSVAELPVGGDASSDFLEPGQVGRLSLTAGMRYTATNPYETEDINFLQIWLTKSLHEFAPAVNQARFDLSTKNTLLPFGTADVKPDRVSARGFMGQYDGRQEGTYAVRGATEIQPNRVFVFALQGVFEAANRLLHEKDALALLYEQNDVLEFEALSNDAILLLIDMPANT